MERMRYNALLVAALVFFCTVQLWASVNADSYDFQLLTTGRGGGNGEHGEGWNKRDRGDHGGKDKHDKGNYGWKDNKNDNCRDSKSGFHGGRLPWTFKPCRPSNKSPAPSCSNRSSTSKEISSSTSPQVFTPPAKSPPPLYAQKSPPPPTIPPPPPYLPYY